MQPHQKIRRYSLVYKENNEDLKNAYGNNLKFYYEHYVTTGCKENRVHQ